MAAAQIINVLSAVQNLLCVVLVVKLWQQKLVSRYRLFSIYILLQLISGLVRLAVKPSTNQYAYYYFFTQPILIFAAFLAISEVYGLVLKDRPGIAKLGKRVLPASVVAAVLLSGVTLFIRWSEEGSRSPFLDAYLTSEQFLYGSILLVVLLISVFLLWFPVPLSRNVVLHSSLFAAYLFVHAILRMFILAKGVSVTALANVALLSCSLTCLAIWILFLSPKGDTVLVKAGAHQWTPEQERRLLHQLDSINATLQNSTKK